MTIMDERTPRRRSSARAALAGDTTDVDERAVELNATAYAIWELCDGHTTIAEMVAAATELFDAPPERIAGDVERILGQLDELRLIKWTPKEG